MHPGDALPAKVYVRGTTSTNRKSLDQRSRNESGPAVSCRGAAMAATNSDKCHHCQVKKHGKRGKGKPGGGGGQSGGGGGKSGGANPSGAHTITDTVDCRGSQGQESYGCRDNQEISTRERVGYSSSRQRIL